MTQHVNEDTLIKLSLGLLDLQDDRKVRSHLESCPMCRLLQEDVDRTMRDIKNVAPQVTAKIPLLPFRRDRFTWIRIAAMLVIGFGLGFAASESLRSPSITIVRQHLVPTPPVRPTNGFVACDDVDLMSIK
jgi:hypothetical protein